MKCSLNYQKCIEFLKLCFSYSLNASAYKFINVIIHGHIRSGPNLAETGDPWPSYLPHPPLQTVSICHKFQQLTSLIILILRDEGRAVGGRSTAKFNCWFPVFGYDPDTSWGKGSLEKDWHSIDPCTGVWDGRTWRRQPWD